MTFEKYVYLGKSLSFRKKNENSEETWQERLASDITSIFFINDIHNNSL